jgi:PilZ domain-containing protein
MPDKPEPRVNVDLPIRVFGMGADSRPFSQNAHARNISDHGAKLSGLEKPVRPGDVIGVQFGDKKARCKVIWVVDAGPVQKIKVGVNMLEGQGCPWQKELETQQATTTAPVVRTAPGMEDKRTFPRQRIPFPIEIRDEQGVGTHMRTKTADINGRGCYVETMLPLPVGKVLNITFWLNSEPVHTPAIVRTCDGGVGMGIEFTGLDEATQKRLQQQVEAMAAESASQNAQGGV